MLKSPRLSSGTKKTGLIRFFSYIILTTSPWILLLIVSSIVIKTPISSFTPVWNDELLYWHEILSFYTKGTNFGYYTINELTPAIYSFGHHGFGSIIPYALYAKVFGWNYNSMVIANTIFVSFAFLLLILITKPSSLKAFLLSAIYISFTPAILYSTTSMTELLNFSVLIIYFSLLSTYIHHPKSKKILTFILLFTTVISFIRIIYIILFIPIIIVRNEGAILNKKTSYHLALWILISVGLYFISSLFNSPFPESFLYKLFSSPDKTNFLINFIKHFGLNILRFVYPLRDEPIEVLQRYLIALFLLWMGRKLYLSRLKNRMEQIDITISFIVLVLALLVIIAAYDVFALRDFRVLAPFVFGILLFLTLSNRLKVMKYFFAANLISLIILILSPRTAELFFFNNERYSPPTKNIVLDKVEYCENTIDKFVNTLVVEEYNKNTLNLKAGIGITYVDSVTDNLKSNYIFTKRQMKLISYDIIAQDESNFLYEKRQVE